MPHNAVSVPRISPIASLAAIAVLGIVALAVYVFSGLSVENWEYNFPRRGKIVFRLLFRGTRQYVRTA